MLLNGNIMLNTRKIQVFRPRALTNTNEVISDELAECGKFVKIAVFVKNNHNKKVDIRLVGNESSQPGDTIPLSRWVTCDEKSKSIISVEPHIWMIYMGVSIKPLEAPGSGDIEVLFFAQEDMSR